MEKPRNENITKNRTIQSPFIKYCTTTVICLLMCGAGFLFLVFGTNSLYTLNEIEVSSKQSTLQQTTVSTVVNNIENESNSTVQNPAIPGLNPDLSDKQVYDILSNSAYASKAYALSCVYKAVRELVGYNAAVGVMANVWHEGNLGLVQYNHSVPNWDGAGNASPVSKPGAPVIVSSAANAAAVRALGADGSNSTGVGIVQWTYHAYMGPLADSYERHCSSYSQEELAAAEIEQLVGVVNTHAAGLGGTPEECSSYWLKNYEKPSNMASQDTVRRSTATDLNTLLNGG